MRLRSLKLEDFRSFSSSSFNFLDQTAICGDNGTGKSTLIEAIRLISIGKSFRASRFDELIKHDQPYFRIQAQFEDATTEYFYGVPQKDFPKKERRLVRNGQELNLFEYIGTFPTVLFTPDDCYLVLGTPKDRRRFLDGALFQTDKSFRKDLMELNRVLKERSRCLFLVKVKQLPLKELNPWTTLLLKLTRRIRKSREAYLSELNQYLKENNGFLPIDLKYQSSQEDPEAVLESELRLAQNLIGPHRDEVVIDLNGRLGRVFASRGQARTVAALLKLGEVNYFLKQNTRPTILLDDVFSELDQKNSDFLLSRIPKELPVIITTASIKTLIERWHRIDL